MKHHIKFIIVSALFFFASPAFGYQWDIDSVHSEIRFQVKHILTTVSGTFTEFRGQVDFDPNMPEKGKFDFTVDVKSVNTNHGKRDNDLRSKNFFNTNQYPEMSFKSTKISHKTNNIYNLEGKMTIKDVTKTLSIEFEFLNPTTHPFHKNKKVAGFITKFTIPRLDYHVGNGEFLKMGVVGRQVFVEIAMEALTDK